MSGDETARIGIVGADVPRQVVLASGAVPHRLFGAWHGEVSGEASDLLGAADAVAGRILDALLQGRHALEGLVVCNDSAADLRLFYVLRILSRSGRIPFPVHLLDAPRGAGLPRHRFVTRQYARLADFCGAITGGVVDAGALGAAAARERDLGAALRRLRERRVAGDCAGEAALAAYRDAARVDPETAIALVDAAASPSSSAPVRAFATGSAHPDPSLYETIEAAGSVIVVGEDHDTGDGGWLGDAVPGGEPDAVYAALAERHLARPPLAARSRSAERAALLAARVAETRATAVVALVRELDDAPAWDLPAQRAAVTVPLEARIRIAPGDGRDAAARAAGALARLAGEAA